MLGSWHSKLASLPTSLFFSILYAGLYVLIYFLTGILLSDKSYYLHKPLQIFC